MLLSQIRLQLLTGVLQATRRTQHSWGKQQHKLRALTAHAPALPATLMLPPLITLPATLASWLELAVGQRPERIDVVNTFYPVYCS